MSSLPPNPSRTASHRLLRVQLLRIGKPCPLCNEPGFTTIPVQQGPEANAERFPRLYCPHRLRGCESVGELGKLDEHVNSDPQPDRQLKGCQFAVVECLHCKEGIRRSEMPGHRLEAAHRGHTHASTAQSTSRPSKT